MNKFFEYKSTVTVGDTNIQGNMYFSNYFKIQGITRELWMNKCVKNSNKHLSSGLILITKNADCDYIKRFYLNDEISCRMSVGRIKRVSFDLIFHFCHSASGKTHAIGHQKIVFANSADKVIKMPDDFYFAAVNYQNYDLISIDN